MKLLLDRKWKRGGYTIGVLYIDGVRFSDTLEDRDRGLDSGMDVAEIGMKKVYGETAVPTGTYEVRLTWSQRFHGRGWCKPYGGRCPQVMDVKGFDGVRIHPFNTAAESLGCIAVGRNTEKGKVL